jgi:MFS family permease
MRAESHPPPVRPLAAFAVPNFRRFVAGQTISLVGSWTETVAQAVLVLQLTHSGVWLGLATAARYAPVLLLTPYAGVIVDRQTKRRLLLLTQSSLAAASLVLGALVLSGGIRLWMVFAVALVFGTLTALDNPARLAFISEMVGERLIRNAVTLNSTLVNVGRAIGPIVAATLVSAVGVGWCFVANAASFGAVIASLVALNLSQLHPSAPVRRGRGQLRQGLAYARTVPEILAPVAMMALIGTLTYEYEVSLPLFGRGALHGGPTTYSALFAAFGFGSVVGGIYCTRHPKTGVPRMIRAAVAYAAAMLATALTTRTYATVALLTVVGFASITFLTTGNSTVQLAARPDMRGRMTALWSTAFIGSTPIGATIIGAIGATSPQLALLIGAAACGAAALTGSALLAHARATTGRMPDPAALEPRPLGSTPSQDRHRLTCSHAPTHTPDVRSESGNAPDAVTQSTPSRAAQNEPQRRPKPTHQDRCSPTAGQLSRASVRPRPNPL